MQSPALLVEFLTEELPPHDLYNKIAQNFTQTLLEQLNNFLTPSSEVQIIASPRRFGCLIKQVKQQEPTQSLLRKGPSIEVGLKAGVPSKALIGFMKSCKISNHELLKQQEGYFYAQITNQGRAIEQVIAQAIIESIKRIPISKNMRWGDNEFQFVRPVHNLLLMLGTELINIDNPILGKYSSNYTYGHRFMSNGKIIIDNAVNYFEILKNVGYVYANYDERKNLIYQGLINKAQEQELRINVEQELLNEVCALVEYPIVMQGEFPHKFLTVPSECLVLTMAKNQRYFALFEKQDGKKLSNKFLFVSNIKSPTPQTIIDGNQKVLVARLNDAEFFFNTDQKTSLEIFAKRLNNVVYHNKLGSMLKRVSRIQNIVQHIAPLIGADKVKAELTAKLMKADLVSEMVGEFPELQGTMGKYYALHESLPEDVALAIEQHYLPKFSGDQLPESTLGTCMALADKLEVLIGIWGIGLIPSGDKDPYALRRNALGIVRILLNYQLNINQLLDIVYISFTDGMLSNNTTEEVYQFILSRLSFLLTNEEFGFSTTLVQSVIKTNPKNFSYIKSLIMQLQIFVDNKLNQALLSANKRIENILKKQNSENKQDIQPKLFVNQCEHLLYDKLMLIQDQLSKNAQQHDWEKYFKLLEEFNTPITSFFDQVMVNDDNIEIRNNRLSLIQSLYTTMNQYCILSEL